MKVKDIFTMRRWVEGSLLDTVFYHQDTMGRPVSKYDQKFIGNMKAMRLGPLRMRQLRVKNGKHFVFIPHLIDWEIIQNLFVVIYYI